MPIRERVQRLWRLVVGWWRPSSNNGPASTLAPTASASSARATAVVPRGRRGRAAPDGARAEGGEPLIGGVVTVRMWVVGGRLVLATSPSDAERALLALLPELDAEGQGAARTLLDTLRGGHAAAA